MINRHYYLIGGTFQYFGNDGYSVFTFVADSPLGPFRPYLPRFRLCGNSNGKYLMGKQWQASFGKGKNDEVLITNYLTAPESDTNNFIGTKEKVWLLPIKKAIIGIDNELTMGYWNQNDLLKAKEIPINFSSVLLENMYATVEDDTIYLKTPDYCREPFNSLEKLREVSSFVFLEPSFDMENGVVIEGIFQISHNGKLSKAIWGILLGQTKDATLISLEAGDRRTTKAKISIVKYGNMDQQEVVDVITNTCAGRTNLTLDQLTTLRLLVRQNIFELSIDDILVQSYTLGGRSNGRIGFYVKNCSMTLKDLKAYLMDLNEFDLAEVQ